MRFLKKYSAYIFALSLALVILLGILILRLPAFPSAFSIARETTQAPEALPKQPTNEPELNTEAVTILADNIPICTLINEAEAMALLRYELVQAFTPPQGEKLLSAEFEKHIELRYAKPGEEPMLLSRAKGLLKTEAALCPVIYTTRTVYIDMLEFKQELATDKRIPKNARLVNALGKTGEQITVTETTYINKVREGNPKIVERFDLSPSVEKVSSGAYKPKQAGREPGKYEGEKGPDAPLGFNLTLPADGKISSNFGMRNESMHYGLDISCKIGSVLTAPESGKVIFASMRSNYGFVLEIEHALGFVTRLAPVGNCTLAISDYVKKGQQIGELALPQDEETEPHLHMELLIGGIPYNPRQYL